MPKIETNRPRVAWSWVAWMVFPWLTHSFTELCSESALVFTMRKFVSDPALIAFLSSLNIAFNFAVGTVTSYMSDRIWTRWGRRRPFLIVGWAGLSVCMFFVPFAPNLWSLVAIIVLYQFFQDIAKPYEPLYNEVIPSQQRGRAATMRNIMQNVTGLFFNAVLIAQFDREYGLDVLGRTVSLSGEKVLYWTGSMAIAAVTLFMIFGVHETRPLHGVVREKFSLQRLLREVFGHRQWWLVYLLYACPLIAGAGTSMFRSLFLTEELGLTKQHVGWTMGVVMVLSMIIFVPLSGFLADRVFRLRLFQIGLFGQAFANFIFYLYAQILDGSPAPTATVLFFLCFNEVFATFAGVLWGPLVYDYIPRDRFGTVSAGFSFAGGLAGFLVINGAGLWIKGFTALFGSAASGSPNYSSVYIFQLFVATIALCFALYFEREVRRGRVIAYGSKEAEERHQPEKA